MGNTKSNAESNIGRKLIMNGVLNDDLEMIQNGLKYKDTDLNGIDAGAPFIYRLMILILTKNETQFKYYVDMFESHMGYDHKIKKRLCIYAHKIYKPMQGYHEYHRDSIYDPHHSKKYVKITMDFVFEVKDTFYFRLKHHSDIKDVLFDLMTNLCNNINYMLAIKMPDQQQFAITPYVSSIKNNIKTLIYTIIDRENKIKLMTDSDTDTDTDTDSDTNNLAMECCICMDNKRNTLFYPCKHVGACDICASIIQDCPLCRQKIETTETVFI